MNTFLIEWLIKHLWKEWWIKYMLYDGISFPPTWPMSSLFGRFFPTFCWRHPPFVMLLLLYSPGSAFLAPTSIWKRSPGRPPSAARALRWRPDPARNLRWAWPTSFERPAPRDTLPGAVKWGPARTIFVVEEVRIQRVHVDGGHHSYWRSTRIKVKVHVRVIF